MDIVPDAAIGKLDVRGHVCWLVTDPDAYSAAAPELLAEGRRLGHRSVGFGPGIPRGTTDLAGLVLGAVADERRQAHAEGLSGVRIVADMDWLLPLNPSTAQIIDLELALSQYLVGQPDVTVVCAYRESSFDIASITAALTLHTAAPGVSPQFRFTAGSSAWLLSGAVDVNVRDTFEDVIHAAVRRGPRVIDISELGFIDVGGMRAVVSAGHTQPDLLLNGASVSFRRLWEVCGFAEAAPMVRLDTCSA